jgi:alpha-beta hydrolase superfamily lysophospholipase
MVDRRAEEWAMSLRAIVTVAIIFSAGAPVSGHAQSIPPGAGRQTVTLAGLRLKVFTYRPDCGNPSLLVVLHGQNRNAEEYRDWARPLADRDCRLVAAPEFDRARFPRWRYQHGGIAQDGVTQDRNEWTGSLVVHLVERIRNDEGKGMPYALIGHSAGGQFLSRLAAFVDNGAQRIVIANPGTHVFPDPKVKAPYGLGGVYPPAAADAALRRYLSQPITIFLGQDDTKDEGLNEGREAMAQGPTRYERGLNAFKAGRAMAQASSWPFNWRLIELPGVGHKAPRMLSSKEASDALRP